jgi:GAF domain-containing protein
MAWIDRLDDRDVSVIVSELLIATADSTDPLVDGSVGEVLATLRRKLGMDVVFVSEFVDGRRVFRFVDHSGPEAVIRPGDSNPVEESFCQRVVDGRLPGLIHDVAQLPPDADLPPTSLRLGGHLSTPIVLKTGEAYGTLCCFSARPSPQLRDQDLETLKLCAKLVARKVELTRRDGFGEPPPDWGLEPMSGTGAARH